MVYKNLDKTVRRSLVRVPGTGTDVSRPNLVMDLSSTSTHAALVQVSPVDCSQFDSQATPHQSQFTKPTLDVEATKKKLKPDMFEQVHFELQLEKENLNPLQQLVQQFVQQRDSQHRRRWEQVPVQFPTTAGQEWKQIIIPVATDAAQQPRMRQQLGLLARQLIQGNSTPLKEMLQQAVQQHERHQKQNRKWQVALAPVTTTTGTQWRLIFLRQRRAMPA